MGRKNKDFWNTIKSTLKDGEVYDENTHHKFVEEGGKIVEYKYCTNCGEWKPLDHFYPQKGTADCLAGWCKRCAIVADAERRKKKKIKHTPKVVSEHKVVESKPITKTDPITSLIEVIKTEQEKKDKEIARLQAELSAVKSEERDFKGLKESEIEAVIANNNIPIRVLFKAIADRTNDRYKFFATDIESGLTMEIKTAEATERVKAVSVW